MAIGDPAFPSVLRDAGYGDVILIEPDAATSEGNTQLDLVLGSTSKVHCLVWESKATRDVNVQQAAVLGALDAALFANRWQVQFSRRPEFSWSVSYVTPGGYEVDLCQSLDDAGLAYALVCIDAEMLELRLVRGDLEIFSPGPFSPVDPSRASPLLYPFDRASELHEVVPWVVHALNWHATRQDWAFNTVELTETAFGQNWWRLSYAEVAKHEMVTKVERILVDSVLGGRAPLGYKPPLAQYIDQIQARSNSRSEWLLRKDRLRQQNAHLGFRRALEEVLTLYAGGHRPRLSLPSGGN